MTDVDPVDDEALEKLRSWGGDDLLKQMISLFLENAPLRIAAAVSAGETGEVEAVLRAAHSLKSTAATLGATRLHQLAGTIEQLAEAGDLAPIAPLIQELEGAFESVRVRLEQESQGMES